LKTRLPVRSALFKQRTGGLVVKWVTISESPLLYVFVFLLVCFVFCTINFRKLSLNASLSSILIRSDHIELEIPRSYGGNTSHPATVDSSLHIHSTSPSHLLFSLQRGNSRSHSSY
jgi:hypothetical protein